MAAEPVGPPHSTREARPDELMELVGLVRRELVRRGESLAPGWVDQAVVDLRTGDLTGWYYPTSSSGPALGFFSARPARAYGHIHVEPGERAAERALSLAKAMAGGLPEPVQRLDVGITGVPSAEEGGLR
ncbi:MAG: hypothetical protein L3J96_05430, partial [Thermoplasmata archaeon]|nr:hypothetical protein [Thermoplasmata archaeon]